MQKKRDNGIAEHTRKSNHKISWNGRVFLDSHPHWRKRKIKEAIFIDCLNPSAEISSNSKIMNLEKGMVVSNCWKEFNGEVRKIFSKKLGIQQNSHKSTTRSTRHTEPPLRLDLGENLHLYFHFSFICIRSLLMKNK